MIDIVSLIQSRGVTLTKNNQHYLGKCPFHANSTTDSLVVDSKDNSFLCEKCDLVGDPALFISKFDGVSLRHAEDLITNGGALVYEHKEQVVKKTTVTSLPCPLSADAEGEQLLSDVIDYYHGHLLNHQPAIEYFKKRGLWNEEVIKKYKIGFADRSLGLRLPNSQRVAGKKIRSNLVNIGIYRSTGHAHFNGCLVVPVSNNQGEVTNLYGRRIDARSPKIQRHLTLHNEPQIFNLEALEHREVILTDTVLNTLTFLSSGLPNALCVIGDEVLSVDLLELLKVHKIDSVHLALPSTEEGEKQTLQIAEKLKIIGVSVSQIKFPWGMDSNDVLVKKGGNGLTELHRNALWLGGRTHDIRVIEVTEPPSTTHKESIATQETPQKHTNIKKVGDYYHLDLGDCSYRVGGLDNNNNMAVMKVTLRVSCEGLIHIDNVDLYKDSDRRKFIDRANEECLLDKALLKRDLGKILIMLEQEMEQRIYHTEVEPKQSITISDEDRAEALELLKSTDLLQKIESVFDDVGLQGERSNKMTAFLSMIKWMGVENSA